MNSSRSWPCAALSRADLGPRTTLRVGGHVEWLLEPATPDELVLAWHEARERGLEPRVLGGGANLLVADGLHPGAVIATERLTRVFRPLPGDDDALSTPPQTAGAVFEPRGLALTPPERETDTRLVAWAGAGLPGLVRTARDLAWSGLEGLVGVPGQLGGGVAMNAGGRWGDMWDVVESVRILRPDGEVQDLERGECEPRYRDANLGGALVLGAVLRLEPADKEEIRERMRQYLAEKSAAQPVTERSCGCIFKNPDPELADGRSAGQLVDQCGGRGLESGEAVVSPKHGNFIVNRGRASAADVLHLVEELRRLVADRTGIRLETEVKVWEPA